MGTMTAAEYQQMLRKKKANKFKAQRTSDGWPSKLEKATYGILELRQAGGEIRELRRYDKVVFGEGLGRLKISWTIDFWAIDTKTDKPIWFEAKGMRCSSWIKFESVWKEQGPGKLVLYMGDYRNPTEMPPIIPSGKAQST